MKKMLKTRNHPDATADCIKYKIEAVLETLEA